MSVIYHGSFAEPKQSPATQDAEIEELMTTILQLKAALKKLQGENKKLKAAAKSAK